MAGDWVRVLLVDDSAAVRVVLRSWLPTRGTFAVMAEADRGDEALELASSTQPDVIILEARLFDDHPAEAISQLLLAAPDAKVVVWSEMLAVPSRVLTKAGVDAVVDKDAGGEALLAELMRLFPAAAS